MDPDTRTPIASPCMLRTMKNNIFRAGVMEKAPTQFQTTSQANAPTISALGRRRSVSEPESMTDKPFAMLKAPCSHGNCVLWIPRAFLNMIWLTLTSPRNHANRSCLNRLVCNGQPITASYGVEGVIGILTLRNRRVRR